MTQHYTHSFAWRNHWGGSLPSTVCVFCGISFDEAQQRGDLWSDYHNRPCCSELLTFPDLDWWYHDRAYMEVGP